MIRTEPHIEKAVINEYMNDVSRFDIAEKYNINARTVLNILHRNNVTYRHPAGNKSKYSTEQERIEARKARDRIASAKYRKKNPTRHKEWREKNPERSRQLNRAYQQRISGIIKQAKQGQPCGECGREDLPSDCLDFHHVRGTKLFNIGRWYEYKSNNSGKSKADLVREEIAKCEVVCPTCHRLTHSKQKDDCNH